MAKKTLETFEDFKSSILSVKGRGGQCWTNIVGCELRMADEKLGMEEANRLIRECGLLNHGWQEEQ